MVVVVVLLCLLIAHPIFESWRNARVYYHVIFDIVLVASLFAVSQSRLTLILATVLGLPAFILFWASELPGVHQVFSAALFDGGRHFLMAGFMSVIASFILWYVMRSEKITINILCGAISVYLLIGLIGGLVYSGLAHIDPNSFQFSEALKRNASGKPIDWYERSSLLLYFSFVTQSTLGYGDIRPITASARTLSAIQAILGQMYLAVLIARLVGLHIAVNAVNKHFDLKSPKIPGPKLEPSPMAAAETPPAAERTRADDTDRDDP